MPPRRSSLSGQSAAVQNAVARGRRKSLQNSWSGPTLAQLDEPALASLTERLRTYYMEHNPMRAGQLNMIFEVYSVNPLCIFPDLDKKYAVVRPTNRP